MPFLGTVVAEAQNAALWGTPARTISLIMTDGADNASRRFSAGDVARLVADIQTFERRHIVAAIGYGGAGGGPDFRDIFAEMGIEDRWIFTPGRSEQEIRAAFDVFSQSVLTLSKNAGAMGGGFAI